GWSFLIVAALVGLLVASGWFHVVRWYRERAQHRRNLTVVAHGGISAPRWTVGPAGILAHGLFDIANICPAAVTIPRTVLQIFYGELGVILGSSNITGAALGIVGQPGKAAIDRNIIWQTPTVIRSRAFRARVALVDNFGAYNWGTWASWERV